MTEEETIEEKSDQANRDYAENQTGDEREEKEQCSRQKRNSRLRRAELAAPAL